MTNETALAIEERLTRRFSEIEEKYRREDQIALGEATPDELRELAVIDRQLRELRAPKAVVEEETDA